MPSLEEKSPNVAGPLKIPTPVVFAVESHHHRPGPNMLKAMMLPRKKLTKRAFILVSPQEPLSRTPGSDLMADTRQPCSTASASCQYERQGLFPNQTGDRTCTRCESFQCSSRQHSHAASFLRPLLNSRVGLVASLFVLLPVAYLRMTFLECHLLGCSDLRLSIHSSIILRTCAERLRC